ncbi:MAG TPA: hypothetical protein PLV23_01925 [Sedimentibacter sp.]|nr:hypothetical protein [Sedimentibacter sp.]
MKINLSSTCGNSPKNKFVQDFTVKLLSFDFDNLANMSVENVKILIPDRGLIEGRSNLGDIKKYLKTDIKVLTIDSAISHGKYGAVLCEVSDNEKDYKISVHYIFENIKAEFIEEAIVLIVEINR